MPERCVADLRERGYLVFEGFLGAGELDEGLPLIACRRRLHLKRAGGWVRCDRR